MSALTETLAFLDERGIPYALHRHEAAASLSECARVAERIGAMICKNYFLSTRNRKRHALCVVRPDARLRTADLSAQVGSARLSFGKEEDLLALLHTRPGSVSPLGLIYDRENAVRLLIDRALRDEATLAFHPCDNTASVVLASSAFFDRFLPAVGRVPEWVEIHDFMEQ